MKKNPTKKKQKKQKMPQKINRAIETAHEKKSNPKMLLYELSVLLLMSSFIIILYSNTINYPFHFDDEAAIVENHNLHLSKMNRTQVSKLFKNLYGPRPLPKISFALNYYFGELNTSGYHLANIVIHLINGILIFYFVKLTMIVINDNSGAQESKQLKLDSELLIPFFSSLIWLVHPLHTNSVTYIVQRMNIMATTFYMLSILLFILGRRIQIKITYAREQRRGCRSCKNLAPLLYFTGSLISWVMAMACKEIAITLPFLIVLYEFYFFQNLASSWSKKFTFFLCLLSIAFIIIFLAFWGFEIKNYFFGYYYGYSFTMLQRVLTECRVLIYYISLFFFPYPDRLNFDYDFPLSNSLTDPSTTFLSLCALICLSAVAIISAKRERLLSFGILWFLGNLILESSIIPLDIIFEHRTYLPSILLSVITTSAVWYFKGSYKLKIGFLTTLIAVLSCWTVQRNDIWRNPIALWQDCVQKSPKKDRPHANLGKSFEMAGRIDEAILEYKKALTINPYHQFALNNMGLAMYKKGNLDEAIQYYRKAIQSDPGFAEAHNNLGVALVDQNKLEEGILHYKEAIRLKPDHPQAPGNLKKAVEGLNKIDNNIDETQEKLKLDPNNYTHHYRLGVLFYLKGHFDTAIRHYNNALSIKPDHIKSLNGLSAVYSKLKQYDTAITVALKSLEIHPENPAAYYNIACIYSLQNNKKYALTWLQKAIDKGFNKWDLMKIDKDLIQIRNTESFKNIVKNKRITNHKQ